MLAFVFVFIFYVTMYVEKTKLFVGDQMVCIQNIVYSLICFDFCVVVKVYQHGRH